jgi:hypothetical protein
MERSLSKNDRFSIARFRHEKVKDSERRERNASQKKKAGVAPYDCPAPVSPLL